MTEKFLVLIIRWDPGTTFHHPTESGALTPSIHIGGKEFEKMKTVRSQFIRLCPVTLLLILLAFMFSACSGETGAKKEKTVAQTLSPSTVDPQMAVDDGSSSVLSYSQGGLYKYNASGELVPCLAENYDVSDDGCTFTFHLKEGLKWSDGRPLSAEDFVYAFKRIADPDMGSNAIYLIADNSRVKNAREVNAGELPVSALGVSAPDDRTFIVELEEPCPFFSHGSKVKSHERRDAEKTQTVPVDICRASAAFRCH